MENFLNVNNFTNLVNTVFIKIKNRTGRDISKSPKYINLFKRLIATIHDTTVQRNQNHSTDYLNNLVIEKTVPYMIAKIEKENSFSNQESNDFSNLQLGGNTFTPSPLRNSFTSGQQPNQFTQPQPNQFIPPYQPNNEPSQSTSVNQQQNNFQGAVPGRIGESTQQGTSQASVLERMRQAEQDRNYTTSSQPQPTENIKLNNPDITKLYTTNSSELKQVVNIPENKPQSYTPSEYIVKDKTNQLQAFDDPEGVKPINVNNDSYQSLNSGNQTNNLQMNTFENANNVPPIDDDDEDEDDSLKRNYEMVILDSHVDLFGNPSKTLPSSEFKCKLQDSKGLQLDTQADVFIEFIKIQNVIPGTYKQKTAIDADGSTIYGAGTPPDSLIKSSSNMLRWGPVSFAITSSTARSGAAANFTTANDGSFIVSGGCVIGSTADRDRFTIGVFNGRTNGFKQIDGTHITPHAAPLDGTPATGTGAVTPKLMPYVSFEQEGGKEQNGDGINDSINPHSHGRGSCVNIGYVFRQDVFSGEIGGSSASYIEDVLEIGGKYEITFGDVSPSPSQLSAQRLSNGEKLIVELTGFLESTSTAGQGRLVHSTEANRLVALFFDKSLIAASAFNYQSNNVNTLAGGITSGSIKITSIVKISTNHLEDFNFLTLEFPNTPNFVIRNFTNNQDLKDKYIIPNEAFGKTDSGAEGAGRGDATSYNIKLKSNYLTTIPAGSYSEINVLLKGYRVPFTNTTKSNSIDENVRITEEKDRIQYDVLEATDWSSRVMIGLLIKKTPKTKPSPKSNRLPRLPSVQYNTPPMLSNEDYTKLAGDKAVDPAQNLLNKEASAAARAPVTTINKPYENPFKRTKIIAKMSESEADSKIVKGNLLEEPKALYEKKQETFQNIEPVGMDDYSNLQVL